MHKDPPVALEPPAASPEPPDRPRAAGGRPGDTRPARGAPLPSAPRAAEAQRLRDELALLWRNPPEFSQTGIKRWRLEVAVLREKLRRLELDP